MKEKRDEFAEKLEKLSETRFKDMRGTVLGLTFTGFTFAYYEGQTTLLELLLGREAIEEQRSSIITALTLSGPANALELLGVNVGSILETGVTTPGKVAAHILIGKELERVKRVRDVLEDQAEREKKDKEIAELYKLYAKAQFLQLMTAMGMAGGTIYLLQETSVTQLIENIPFIE
jgi:hypothetical protein